MITRSPDNRKELVELMCAAALTSPWKMRAALDAIEAAGLVVAPKEATALMLAKGYETPDHGRTSYLADVYRAALSASPFSKDDRT